jgi:hypothetical protein
VEARVADITRNLCACSARIACLRAGDGQTGSNESALAFSVKKHFQLLSSVLDQAVKSLAAFFFYLFNADGLSVKLLRNLRY